MKKVSESCKLTKLGVFRANQCVQSLQKLLPTHVLIKTINLKVSARVKCAVLHLPLLLYAVARRVNRHGQTRALTFQSSTGENTMENEPIEFDNGHDENAAEFGPRRLRKAEGVLRMRTSRILLVIERSVDSYNHLAALRTAEAFGVQHVWFVDPPFVKQDQTNKKRASAQHNFHSVARCSMQWLTIRHFDTSQECIAALHEEGREIWVTELSQEALPLIVSPSSPLLPLPKNLAIVIGREIDGVSKEMIANASRRIYFPMRGFADSLNLSVACSVILDRLFLLCPEAIGEMPEEERQTLREQWFLQLANTDEQKEEFTRWAREDSHKLRPFGDVRRADCHRVEFVRKRVLAKGDVMNVAEREKHHVDTDKSHETARADPNTCACVTPDIAG